MDGLDEHGNEWNGVGYANEDIPAGAFVEADFEHGQVRLRRPNTTATHPKKPEWRAPDPFNSDDCLIRLAEHPAERLGINSGGTENFEPTTDPGDVASYRYVSPVDTPPYDATLHSDGRITWHNHPRIADNHDYTHPDVD